MSGWMKKAALIASLLVGLVFAPASGTIWGCGEGPQLPRRPRSAQVPSRAEQRLQREVLHELRMLPYFSVFDNLEFKVQGYKVTLFGQVVNPTLKSDAEGVVKRIEGVEKVDNKIEVLPLSNFDDRIRLAEYRAIYHHVGLDRYALQPIPPIHIIVKNGNVTLVGVVANTMDKNLAGILANGVPDVFSVTNRLRVEKD